MAGRTSAVRDAAVADRANGTFDFGPGARGWAYRDARSQDVLAWLPLRART